MATRAHWRVKLAAVSEAGGDPQQKAAVAESEAEAAVSEAESAVPESEACSSVAGDTIASSDAERGESSTAAAERRAQLRAPLSPTQGDPNRRKQSSRYNSDWEVGNFGLFFGNWGKRAALKDTTKRARRARHDVQILKCSGQVIILAEANAATEELLKFGDPPAAVAGSPVTSRLDKRETREHWVVRGNEESAILIAARKDNTSSLECLRYVVHDDHPYKANKKTENGEVTNHDGQSVFQTEYRTHWTRSRGDRSSWSLQNYESPMARSSDYILESTGDKH